MNTAIEYAKLAEGELAKLEYVTYQQDKETRALTLAQVYATLAQASATAELQRSIRITNSGVGW